MAPDRDSVRLYFLLADSGISVDRKMAWLICARQNIARHAKRAFRYPSSIERTIAIRHIARIASMRAFSRGGAKDGGARFLRG